MKVQPGIWEWFLRYRREPYPRKVRVRAADLQSAHAYWVRLTRAERPMDFLVADAEVVGPAGSVSTRGTRLRRSSVPGRSWTRRSRSRSSGTASPGR